MKNTIKFVLLSAVALTAICFGNCLAAPLDSIKEDMNTQSVVISGSDLIKNDKVLIEIFNYDDNDIDYENDLEFVSTINVDSKGAYSANIKLPKRVESGKKLVCVKPLVGKYAEEDFEFYSSDSINTILNNWNDAINNQNKFKMEDVVNDETALKIIINSKIVPEVRKELLDKNKDSLTSELLKLSTASSISDFSGDFVAPYINFSINNLTPETASMLIMEFYDIIDTQKGDIYKNLISKLSDENKLKLFADTVKKIDSHVTNEEFVKLLNSCAVYDEFIKIEYYKDVKPYIDLYNTSEYFNIDFSIYNKLKDTYSVDSKVLNKRDSYNDFDSFRKVYTAWIIEQYDAEKKAEKDVGKGSSGSSGGSSGISYTASGDANIGVTPVVETVFDDIDSCPWAEEHIMALYNKGVINGVGKKVFAPNDVVTREQFVKIALALCVTPEEIINSKFEDVVSGEWYEESINIAKQIGLVSGKSESIFGVGENLTRQDAAMIMLNAIKISKPELIDGLELNKLAFIDSGDISSYAVYAVSVLNKLGVVNGNENGYFMPLSSTSRAEAAVMINKVLKLID